jgi:hypothetical protein
MRKTLVFAPVSIVLAVAGFSASSAADPRRDRFVEVPVPIEAKGCYYRRGREYCGRYCYIEVNGRRYCQERRRDAVPQADIEFWMPSSAGGSPMK